MTGHGPDFDAAGLKAYLSVELDAHVTGAEVLADGINLIVAISTDDGREYVLRRPNRLRESDLFNDLRREYEVMERLRDTPVPAPRPVLFCGDESVLGDRFFLMSHVAGAGIPWGSDLPERFRDPDSRRRVAHLLVDTLATIHSVDVDRFEGVCERYTLREQVDAATDRLDRAADVTGRDHATLREVGDWLRRNLPRETETTLVHGDYKPDNVFFAGTDRPEITGVVDWETAFLCDPLTELGYLLLLWRDGTGTPSVEDLEASGADEETARYQQGVIEDGFWPFTTDSGSPSRTELVARYEDQAGIDYENDRFYRAYSAFMLATVWADLHRDRVAAGAREASDYGTHADGMAAVARGIVDGTWTL